MRTIWIAAFLLSCCALAAANDGAVYGVGGSVGLIKPEHSTIRMVRERVDAVVTRGWDTGPKVRCEFEFKNEGKAMTVKMGFPERSDGDAASPNMLKRFRSWVDGKRVKTHVLRSENGDQVYRAWHVKDVDFAAGQTRTLADSYRGGAGGDSTGGRSFAYVLKSGASWKGPVGEAIIKVDVTDMLRQFRIEGAEPKGWSVAGGVISWKLKNFEPKQDVSVYFAPAVGIKVNGTPQGALFYERVRGTSMALARDLARSLDAQWAVRRGVCTITTGNHTLKMTARSRTAVLDGAKKIRLPVAPFVVRDHYGERDLAVPVAAVVRALGGTAKASADRQAMDIRI